MSILDDAIREHLALKRAHGADEAELKRLEDEAFGPPQRPDELDPFAEAPTEFLSAPEEAIAEESGPGGRRVPNIADLQEAPPAPAEGDAQAEPQAHDEPQAPAEPEAFPEPPPADAQQPPAEPVAEGGPNTEERRAIAEQPTQFFDIEAEMGADHEADAAPQPEASAPQAPAHRPPAPEAQQPAAPEAEPPAAEAEPPAASEPTPPTPAPSEPTPTPPDAAQPPARAPEPAAPQPAFDDEEDEDDFWSEQRLSEELDQALEAPVTEEELLPGRQQPAAPFTEEHELEQDEELEGDAPLDDAEEEHPDTPDTDEPEPHASYEPDTGHDDVLEDTPEFLEDAPEDDELWFEQRPPKDFDFDD